MRIIYINYIDNAGGKHENYGRSKQRFINGSTGHNVIGWAITNGYAGRMVILMRVIAAYMSALVIAGMAWGYALSLTPQEEVKGYCYYIWYYPDNTTVAVKMDNGSLYKKTVQQAGLHHDLEECK